MTFRQRDPIISNIVIKKTVEQNTRTITLDVRCHEKEKSV